MSDNEAPTISVVVTCYNLERYIGPAIQSVLDQTAAPCEIIVVDDASVDGSRDVIAAFGDRIRSIRLERNAGVLNATLVGIAAARGDIVAFLDGDDLWHAEKLAAIAPVWGADPDLVLLSHDYIVIDALGRPTGAVDDTHRNTRRLLDRSRSREALSSALKRSILSYRGVWLGSAFSIRRAALDMAELERFIASMSVPGFRRLSYQDHLIAQFVILTNPDAMVGFVDRPLFQYRVFGANSSGLSTTRRQALRTIARGYVNLMGTQQLLSGSPVYHAELRRQHQHGRDHRYMAALYTGRTVHALALAAILSVTYWSPRRTLKETARIVAVSLWGIDRFLEMKTVRARVSDDGGASTPGT